MLFFSSVTIFFEYVFSLFAFFHCANLQVAYGVDAVDVTRMGPSQAMGYEWTITFTNKTVGTDVELLTTSCNQLAGTGVDLAISESEKGNELAGSFALSYNGDLTPGIAYDADAATVQAALNALHSIYPSKVDVTRTAVTTDDRAQVKGYTWSITFDSSTWHDPTGTHLLACCEGSAGLDLCSRRDQ